MLGMARRGRNGWMREDEGCLGWAGLKLRWQRQESDLGYGWLCGTDGLMLRMGYKYSGYGANCL